ncbi:hypothetical protein [Afipia sp. GAS231]|uniref:hypothetical protein n=1 Tax=Afipia sp. GAS231 TaxID=1882747 RepID=UPI00087B846D|nr:hypothetical protein [Afipia sp. GAS231]SDO26620.1 hypothetical protein SAMN05444050_3701 [Afipia sp. GAS231]
MLARLPKPVVIALGVLAAFVALQILWAPLLLFLIGDGDGLGLLLRFGLLAAVIAGARPLARVLKENRASLLTASVAVARTVPPVARTITRGTGRLFNALGSAVTYLRGCRWPKALVWFWLTFGIFLLQAIPDIGFFLMFLAAPLWSIVTINLGFAQLVVEPTKGKISPAWSLVGLAWFFGYAAVAIHGHVALDRLAAEIATENSGQSLPFDPGTQSLVVLGKLYDAPSAERLLLTYPLSVVYEENEDAGDRTISPALRDDRPRFTALRLGAPELCDRIAENARWKAAVTRDVKTTIGGTPFCLYATVETPDLPVVRLRFAQEELRIIGAEGHIDRITLTSGDDKHQVASVKAAPYQYLPLPIVGCFVSGGGSRWECPNHFMTERWRPHPDNVALVGASLGLQPSSPASRSEQIYAAGSAALERAQDLGEAAAAAELDRLLAHPLGSTAGLTLKILTARPDLIASRAERLAVAAAEALTTQPNSRDVQIWSDMMVALPDADFRRVAPSFVSAVLARWRDASGRHYASLGESLIYKLADLGPVALPLLERIYQDNGPFDRFVSVVALCRVGVPATDLTEKIRAGVFGDRHQDYYDFEMRQAMILALMRQGRSDLADAGHQQYDQWAAAGNTGITVHRWSEKFEAKRRIMTPSSSPDACMITRE